MSNENPYRQIIADTEAAQRGITPTIHGPVHPIEHFDQGAPNVERVEGPEGEHNVR
jgi:hypothetical protein